MKCSVCKEQSLKLADLKLDFENEYFCELHYPLYSNDGKKTQKHKWRNNVYKN